MTTAYQENMDKCAIAKGSNLPISTKVSYEIGNAIRNKDVKKVIAFLERVGNYEEAVPYKRFNSDVGHKPGKMASGRYPLKAAEKFLAVIKNAVANAKDKGLNEETLQLVHVCANQGSSNWHYGRQRRRQMKSTNLEIVVKEVSAAKPAKAKAKAKVETKVDAKPAVKAVPETEVKTETEDVKEKASVKEAAPKTEEVKVKAKTKEDKE